MEIIEKIITPISALLGVIVGAFVQIPVDMCREKTRIRKELRLQVVKISQYFNNLTFVFSMIINILDRDLDKEDDEMIHELHKTLLVNVEDIYSILPEIETILFVYFSKLTKHKLYESYEKSISKISFLKHSNLNMNGYFQLPDEVKRNRLELMQEDKNLFKEANEFIYDFKNEYMAFIKG